MDISTSYVTRVLLIWFVSSESVSVLIFIFSVCGWLIAFRFVCRRELLRHASPRSHQRRDPPYYLSGTPQPAQELPHAQQVTQQPGKGCGPSRAWRWRAGPPGQVSPRNSAVCVCKAVVGHLTYIYNHNRVVPWHTNDPACDFLPVSGCANFSLWLDNPNPLLDGSDST